jgi:uncharacterized membrane protein YoaK (UPF0700 family)
MSDASECATLSASHPSSVLIGGCVLTFLSATVNAGFVIRLGTSVSHLTGDLTLLAVDQVGGRGLRAGSWFGPLSATLGFVLGAAISGYFIHHPKLEFSRPYGRSVLGVGLLLLVSHGFVQTNPNLSIALAGVACGLQNALASLYRGMIVRTTHATGLLTDLGCSLGMRLRGHAVEVWRLAVPAALVGSLFLGALVGATLVVACDLPFPLAPGIAYLVLGTGWSLLKHMILPRLRGADQ